MASGNIILYVTQIDNLGDLSHGIKVASLLEERVNISRDRIFVATNAVEAIKLFNKDRFKVISQEDAKKVSEVVLQIVAPADQFATYGPLILQHFVRTLIFYEYGFTQSTLPPSLQSYVSSYSLGVADQDQGLLIEKNWEKLHKIAELPSEERLRLMSPSTCALLKVDPDQDRLFVAYAHDSSRQLEFIKSVLRDAQEDGKNYVFLVTEESQFALEDHIKQLSKGQRKVRCMFARLPSEQFLEALIYSESRCLVTGDMTVSEAISAGKNFEYEQRFHKETFSKSLQTYRTSCATFKECNRKICMGKNGSDRIVQIVSEALQQQIKVIPPIDLRNEKISGFKPGESYLISLSQMSALRMDYSGHSAAYPGLKFSFDNIDLETWLISVTSPH